MTYSDRQLNTTDIIQGYSSVTKYISNWVLTNNGKWMCCWFDPTTKKLQTGYSVDLDFTTTNYAIENVVESSGISVGTTGQHQTALYKRPDNKVLLLFIDITGSNPYTNTAYCYISNTGNGDDWAYYSTIHTVTGNSGGGTMHMTIPVRTSGGRLVLSVHDGLYFQGYLFPTGHVYTSDNDGASWTQRWQGSFSGDDGSSQTILLPNGYLYFVWTRGSGNAYLMRSTDDGISWTNTGIDWASDFADTQRDICYRWALFFDELSQAAYASIASGGSGVYACNWTTYQDFEDKTKWHQLDPSGIGGSAGKIFLVNDLLVFLQPANSGECYCFIWSDAYIPPVSYGHNAAFFKTSTGWKRVRNLKAKDTTFQRKVHATYYTEDGWGRINL